MSKRIRKLSEYKCRPKSYAYCTSCKTIFIDDVLSGTLSCPKCSSYLPNRNLCYEDILLLDKKYKEKVNV